eukprot:9472433-Pyramimonas_sp.AAC.1
MQPSDILIGVPDQRLSRRKPGAARQDQPRHADLGPQENRRGHSPSGRGSADIWGIAAIRSREESTGSTASTSAGDGVIETTERRELARAGSRRAMGSCDTPSARDGSSCLRLREVVEHPPQGFRRQRMPLFSPLPGSRGVRLFRFVPSWAFGPIALREPGPRDQTCAQRRSAQQL